MNLNEMLTAIRERTQAQFMDEVMVDSDNGSWLLVIPLGGPFDINIRLADNSIFLYDSISEQDIDFPHIDRALDYLTAHGAI